MFFDIETLTEVEPISWHLTMIVEYESMTWKNFSYQITSSFLGQWTWVISSHEAFWLSFLSHSFLSFYAWHHIAMQVNYLTSHVKHVIPLYISSNFLDLHFIFRNILTLYLPWCFDVLCPVKLWINHHKRKNYKSITSVISSPHLTLAACFFLLE